MVNKVIDYCERLIEDSTCSLLPFHDLSHTREVAANASYLSKVHCLNSDEKELLQIAAWFHDTGFSKAYKGHEDSSKKIALKFLTQQGACTSLIEGVLCCIDATKMPQKPVSKYAEILCDADLFHLSTTEFFAKKPLLRKEWETFCDLKVNDLEWHQLNLKFLKEHQYQTSYGKKVLAKGKQQNIEKAEQLLECFQKQNLWANSIAS